MNLAYHMHSYSAPVI